MKLLEEQDLNRKDKPIYKFELYIGLLLTFFAF